ncbi:MAG: protein kinase, partial [Verrucomicrobiae bacterium]|nr:protein kinase [Verrucomicrobiae bacterium]NNJ87129.1 protein kinase [Akkermansiaceae bacterium]
MTDRYRIIKLISKDPAGGMYLAEDTTLEREVVFRHIDTDSDTERTEEWAEEFTKFSGKLCALQHPNLQTIYDISTDEGGVSIVTQYVKGESLAERLERGPLQQFGAYRMATDLLEALHAAHTSGVYHGALHTGSVRRLPKATGGHRYIIVDLGLNTLATMVKGEDVHIADPVLLAPELHVENPDPNVRADLFMLGQLCYTALAGGHPFADKSPEQCAAAHLAGELPPLLDFAPGVQADFVDWIKHLTAGDAAQRPGSIKQAMKSLQEISINEPEPNIPGKTQAIGTAVPQPPPTAQAVPTAEPVNQDAQQTTVHEPATSTANKKPIIVIACLSVLIVAALIGVVIMNSGGGDETVDKQSSGLPDGVKVHLHDVVTINTMENRQKPVTIDLESDKTLDWTVAIGAPASMKREQKDGVSYIQSLFAKGKFKEYAMAN